jgi:hypothetical protein
MPTEQYHEPRGELGDDVRTYPRACTSLIEEAAPATGSLGIGSLKGSER